MFIIDLQQRKMGQAQSQVEMVPAASTVAGVDQIHVHNSSTSHPPTSMESLIAEAVAYGNEENESLDAKAQRALECPCIAELRNGPCGVQFSDAFLCFLRSTAEEKGSDCVRPFVALQNCMKVNPNAFSKDILEEEGEVKKEGPPDYKIIPPLWSRESPRPKSKL